MVCRFLLFAGYLEVGLQCNRIEFYTDNLKLCQDNATISEISYFFYENQCCYSYTYDTYASIACFCVDNYCNTKFLQPTIVPQSNDTTTSSMHNLGNATASSSSPPSTMPYNPNNTSNNSHFVSCYECYYTGNSINTSDESACSPQSNSRGGNVCIGVACQTYSYSSPSKQFTVSN